MRKGLGITIAVVGVAATLAVLNIDSLPKSGTFLAEDDKGFANYLAKHGKSYATKEEYQFRLHHYLKSVA